MALLWMDEVLDSDGEGATAVAVAWCSPVEEEEILRMLLLFTVLLLLEVAVNALKRSDVFVLVDVDINDLMGLGDG